VVHVTGEPGTTVRYSVALPTDAVDRPGEFGSAAAVTEMAAAAEAAGFDACHVTDHPFPPARWVAEGGHHALDPLVALAVAAAATSRIGLHTTCSSPATATRSWRPRGWRRWTRCPGGG
jgi:alkanesulfonate monooxygenase SsuD/methylene tetrahydromethanopterin reductase-like flavin-dependent oxidoreductase (luciferase family)